MSNLECSLCNCKLDEDDIAIGYCSVCGELINKGEVSPMAKKKKQEKK